MLFLLRVPSNDSSPWKLEEKYAWHSLPYHICKSAWQRCVCSDSSHFLKVTLLRKVFEVEDVIKIIYLTRHWWGEIDIDKSWRRQVLQMLRGVFLTRLSLCILSQMFVVASYCLEDFLFASEGGYDGKRKFTEEHALTKPLWPTASVQQPF